MDNKNKKLGWLALLAVLAFANVAQAGGLGTGAASGTAGIFQALAQYIKQIAVGAGMVAFMCAGLAGFFRGELSDVMRGATNVVGAVCFVVFGGAIFGMFFKGTVQGATIDTQALTATVVQSAPQSAPLE